MFQKFHRWYIWYINKIKKSPLIAIGGSFVAIFAAIGTIYSGINAIAALFRFVNYHFFENYFLYKQLEKINTGVNVDFVEMIIGKPAKIKKLPSELTNYVLSEKGDFIKQTIPLGLDNLTERIYVHEKYFVQLIVNNEGIVVAYAITTRNPKFNPKIPLKIYRTDEKSINAPLNGKIKIYPYISKLRLGKSKLTELKNEKPEKINIGDGGMKYFYVESHYFGKPGFYKQYLFGFSPAGCCIPDNVETRLVELEDEEDKTLQNSKILNLRNTIIPNTFAVIQDPWEYKNLLKYFMEVGIGPNYYDIWEF